MENLIWIEAESFNNIGGWVIDQQFIQSMGSSYLLAHGFGNPAKDATTTIHVKTSGKYRVWVRTKEWSNCKDLKKAPGRFQLLINGTPLSAIFGIKSSNWHWADGGIVELKAGKTALALRDLTGFEGRCDALVLTRDLALKLPDRGKELADFRRKALGFDKQEIPHKSYDFVVAGGGIAGICASVGAARLGLKVALIHDRPIVGGNNSTDVRVQLGGFTNLPPYPELGNVVKDIDPYFRQNARPAYHYKDELKMDVVKNEPNLDLFLNHSVVEVKMENSEQIASVIAQSTLTGEQIECSAFLFSDCTGDAALGYLAKAEYMYGRESKRFASEALAPKQHDMLTMGASVMWYSTKKKRDSSFLKLPWATQFNDKTYQKVTRGDWNWGIGIGKGSNCRCRINKGLWFQGYLWELGLPEKQ